MVNTSVNSTTDNTNLVTPTPVAPTTTPVPNNVVPQNTNVEPVVTENPEDLDSRWTRWRCLVCNYTYEGRDPLKKCPRCGNDNPDKFDDVD